MNKTVEVIEPTIRDDKTICKKKVAAYARVSTDIGGQKDSFENQKKYYEQMFQNKPDITFVGVFADEAISGTTDNRPGFQRMISLAECGMIDVIYTKSISRFSRNVADLLSYCKRLKDNGINVIFEENSINLLSEQGTLMLTILGAVAQMEVENTSAHVNWTLQRKMQNGEYVGCANPIGYKMVDGQLVIDEEEAKTVRYIFRRYLEGVGCKTIAKELHSMGVKTRRGNDIWYESSVSIILKNEKYKGDLIQGKSVTVNPIGRVRKKNHGEGKMYRIKDDHDAIITEEDWNRAQEIMNQRCVSYVDGRKRGTTRNSKQNAFTSKIMCGYCGRNYVRRMTHSGTPHKKVIWNCSGYCKLGKEACPNCKAIDEEYIKKSIVGLIKNMIDDQDCMFYLSNDRIEQALTQFQTQTDKYREQIKLYQNNLEQKNRKRQKLIDLYLEDEIDKAEYMEKLEVTDHEIKMIQQTIDQVNNRIGEEKVKSNSIQQIQKLINEGSAEGFNETLFDLFVERIIVGGKRSDGKDDPRMLHYELKAYNLCTDMECELIEGVPHYIEKKRDDVARDDDNNAYSLYNDYTCGSRVSFTANEQHLKEDDYS